MNHVSNVLIAALSIALLLSSCLESKKDYEFVPGWYEDSSRITSPPDASHGYFEIYYIANGNNLSDSIERLRQIVLDRLLRRLKVNAVSQTIAHER